MADEIIRPSYRQSNMPWVIMLLLLPLFFIFGWVANVAYENTRGKGLEVGVGGAPGTSDEVLSPTPNSLIESTPTATPIPSPTVTPTEGIDIDGGMLQGQ